MVYGIEKAEKLVEALTVDALLDPPEERWAYKLAPMPCGTRAKIEVIDEDGIFIAYMGEELTVWDFMKVVKEIRNA
jgi:hypothetical protein